MQDFDSLRFTVPPELRKKRLKQVQQTSIFLRFIEENTYEEQKLLFAEIDNILDNGMPLIEYLETGFKETKITRTDYRKIATLCFVETLMEFVEENRERTKDLQRSDDYKQAYEAALRGITHYVHGVIDEFPRETVRCLFLLTDEDIDPHRQGVTMAQLVLHSFTFCKTDEQKTEIEQLIRDCML
ncbi:MULTISPECIES: hypothetical protein [unclassified Parabacteroides]|uniref:hypothetical protein n=1 Tax=unclassified Parabacteroides TaxID=2649774 RepID=UPI0024734B77|nr:MULTISPECIES: hypothetical protein [unclassified Parabacteroides]